MVEVYDMPAQTKRHKSIEETSPAPLGVTENTKRRRRASGADRIVGTIVALLFIALVVMLIVI